MDLIICLLKTVRQDDSIRVIVDKLTKFAHFILVKSTLQASYVIRVFMRDVVRFLGIPKNIVSDRDVKFTFKFWKD